MKSFLLAVAFYALIIAGVGFLYTQVNDSATDAYSAESARVDMDDVTQYDGRLSWEAPGS